MLELWKSILQVIGLLSMLYAVPVSAFEMPDYRLLYQVNYDGQEAGSLEVLIQKKQNQYCTIATTRLSLIARLFLSEQVTETCFDTTERGLRLARGSDYDIGKNKSYRSFYLDYSSAEIHFSQEELMLFSSSHDEFESTSFPLILISHNPQYFAGRTLFDINAKRLRPYVYGSLVDDSMTWNGQDYPVLIIKRYAANDQSRSTSYFLSKENYRIPVKIIDQKKGNATIMTLLEYGPL